MKILKKYYEEKIAVEGMPSFEDLTEDNKRQLRETVGFAFYKVNDAVKAFGEACKPFMKQKAKKYINTLCIDYGDLNYKAEEQIKQAFIDGMNQQLILPGVSKCLNEQTLENINNIMWESHMIKSKTFDRTQGTMIMQELEKWAGR